MALEIEHKYLVSDDSYKTVADKVVTIRQGYLNRLPERTVRVRTIDDKGFLTVKGKNKGDVREEFEYEIPYDDALNILGLCEPGIIEKKRYYIPYEGLIWEVDEYMGQRSGLIVAEVEVPVSGHRYPKPPFIGTEVTGNPQYYNSNL